MVQSIVRRELEGVEAVSVLEDVHVCPIGHQGSENREARVKVRFKNGATRMFDVLYASHSKTANIYEIYEEGTGDE